jgi:anti-sigma regulatory factor (Ser/Thr protein kinase)
VHAEAAFPAELASAPAARRYAAAQLRDWSCEPLVDSAELLISELVVNAVLHAESPVTLRLTLRPDALRVEIADASPEPPRPRPIDPTAVTGRGLLIVDAVATAWGVDPTSQGKVVWFELAADDSDPAPVTAR